MPGNNKTITVCNISNILVVPLRILGTVIEFRSQTTVPETSTSEEIKSSYSVRKRDRAVTLLIGGGE